MHTGAPTMLHSFISLSHMQWLPSAILLWTNLLTQFAFRSSFPTKLKRCLDGSNEARFWWVESIDGAAAAGKDGAAAHGQPGHGEEMSGHRHLHGRISITTFRQMQNMRLTTETWTQCGACCRAAGAAAGGEGESTERAPLSNPGRTLNSGEAVRGGHQLRGTQDAAERP